MACVINQALTVPETAIIPATSNEKHPAPSASVERIVFFDGVCGLCDWAVDFLRRRDEDGILKFAPLQGTTAADLLPEEVHDRLDTIIYYRNGRCYYRSAAVLQIFRDLGGIGGALGTLLWLIPGPLRDIGYRCVSTWRYRIFGKHETCRIPTDEERTRFLD